MIRITLQGDPGFRTGEVQIGEGVHEYQWHLVTWHKQAGGEVHATTDNGERVTLATDAGTGGITIGGERWLLRGCRWDGATMTGIACLAVSDGEMARMFAYTLSPLAVVAIGSW